MYPFANFLMAAFQISCKRPLDFISFYAFWGPLILILYKFFW